MTTSSLDMKLLDSLGLTQAADAKAKAGQAKKIDKSQDTFMKLILAQLKNQDPTKPMDNGAFLSQLAQFKAVSGIDELKSSFDNFAAGLQSNQALQASSMVGRWVMVPSETAVLWSDRPLMGAVDVPSATGNVSVLVSSPDGQVRRHLDLGSQKGGKADFSWDGKDDNGQPMSPGNYQIKASALIDGKKQSIDTYSISPVESVTLNKGGGGFTLNVAGIGSVNMNSVAKIM
ncbi:MAG: flagellar hook assembly protein FlgD [Gammaproteobacteria bacterium]|nr:flagellar hook assembly protein FlgD [Gammaproteobacteria bacterium]